MKIDRDRLTSLGLLILRLGIGCMMLVHGIAKVRGFSELSESFPDPLGLSSKVSLILAIGAEVGCSIFLMFGAWTRLASVPLAFTMAVALFIVHRDDPWNVKELAAIYLLVYLTLLFTGPGRWSLDHFLFSRSRQE